ncbi:MAG: hypothetical protein QXI84_10700 [Thermofilaceae archaeon]
MRFEDTPSLRFICHCVHSRECRKEAAKRLGLPEFLVLGFLVLREFLYQAFYRGDLITISPDRVYSMLSRCDITDRRIMIGVMRAVKKFLRLFGVYPKTSNHVYSVAEVRAALDAVLRKAPA